MEKTTESGVWRLDDGRFFVRTTAKCPKTGKMRQAQQTLDAGQTMEDATNLREFMKKQIRSGGETSPEMRIITLADYAERWIEEKAGRFKPSTLNRYDSALKKRILPPLGHLRVSAIVRRDVAAWCAWVEELEFERTDAETGETELLTYATSTVQGWWSVLLHLLRDAKADGFLETDPVTRVRPPDTGIYNRKERQTLTPDELKRLLAAVKQVAERRYTEVLTLAFTGMRVGELYALTWDDVDLARNALMVTKSVWRGQVGTTKTGTGRTVPCHPIICEALQEHRRWLVSNQHPGLASGLVFPSNVGTYRYPSSLQKALQLSCEVAKIDHTVTPHVFRRTLNTLLTLFVKTDRLVNWSILGHSDERSTQRYTWADPDVMMGAVSGVAEVVGFSPRKVDEKAVEAREVTG